MSKKDFHIFNYRYYFFLLFSLAFFTLIIVRLFDLQIRLGDHYQSLADDNRFYTLEILPERAIFLDRYNDSLVNNFKLYFKLEDENALFSKKEAISRQEALSLMASQSSQLSYEYRRQYRFPFSLAHAIGYVGNVTSEDLLLNDHLSSIEMVGKTGLEKFFDQKLRGIKGQEIYEIDTSGSKQRLIERKEAVQGENIQTALDPYLSEIAYWSLGQQKGVVLIADAKTGQLLVMLSKPSLNINDLSQTYLDEILEDLRKQRVKSYFQDPNQVFFNRAVNGTYPPGSVFKIVTAMTGLEKGVIDAQTTVLDEGVIKVNEWEFRNWYYTQYGGTEGLISLVRAITRSNDIYFYKVAEWIGPDDLAESARTFGFGQETGVELDQESTGTVPDPAWKERVIGEKWYLGNTYHFGIGQGDLLVTPLQILQLVQTIANQGRRCQPTLLKNTQDNCHDLSLKPDNINLVLTGMIKACSQGGTAFPLFELNQLYLAEEHNLNSAFELLKQGAVACKTGTAEFGGANEQGHRKTHGWLVAITDVDQDNLSSQLTASLDKDMPIFTPEMGIKDGNGQSAAIVASYPSLTDFKKQWLAKIREQGFPEQIVMVVMVESDEENPYKEGSADAGLVVKRIIQWIRGE